VFIWPSQGAEDHQPGAIHRGEQQEVNQVQHYDLSVITTFGFSLIDKAVAKVSAQAQCTETTSNQTPPSPQQPPQNRPPQVMILNKPAHDIDTDQIQICAVESDADGDQLFDTWTAQIGNVSSEYKPDPINAPDKVCVEYTPPDVPTGAQEEETVTINVTGGGQSASGTWTT